MSGVGFPCDTVTLFIPAPGGGYEVRLLDGVLLSCSLGIAGGDTSPQRSVMLYYLDARSRCKDPGGRTCGYVSPDMWATLQNREGFFTFDASGGCYICEGDATQLDAPPYSAYRIVTVERPSGGRRRLRHFKITAR